MKNTRYALLAFILGLSVAMTGCGSKEEQNTTNTRENDAPAGMEQFKEFDDKEFGNREFGNREFGDRGFGDKEFGDREFYGKEFGDRGFGNNGFENQGEATYTPLVIEKEDIFSKRDLESSPDLTDAVQIPVKNDSTYTIDSAGLFVVSGNATNFTVKVEAGKEDKVQIVLKDAEITNDDFPVIYVKAADKCFVTSLGENKLSVKKSFKADGDINTDAVIFSKDDLTLNGTGTLNIVSSTGNGITSKDDMKITGGTYNIACALDGVEANDSLSIYDGKFTIESSKDAIHCENDKKEGSIYIRSGSFNLTAKSDGIQATTYLVIDGGEFTVTASEGFEATYVQINDGKIAINASDDGINAAQKSNANEVVIEINGGEITVVMGAGDTDGLDANGVIVVNGGTIDVTGRSTFDSDRGSIYNGGTIIINGEKVDSIPASQMGGPGGRR